MTDTATAVVPGPVAIVRHRVDQPTTSEQIRANATLRARTKLCANVSSRRVNQ
jgi:hypothetical protein